ncbi:MAG: quinone oxidoreductase [Thermodesulfobacteriota bacterium]|nr:quinone oxidoreductase [Thermodesulfobacteriota bacterium]
MGKAVQIHITGSPEVLQWEDIELHEPGPGEVHIRHEAIGLNFIDVYHRTGLYPLPGLPVVLGMEGAGTVMSLGEKVTEFQKGDRVAYAGIPPGAYAEERLIPAHRLIKLPEAISFRQAAAMMLQGMTARYLLFGCYPVKAGDIILVQAAAGGVGTIVCQWARHLGATVIGTVGSDEKAALARAHGCDYPINYSDDDFEVRVREITDNQGVNVVYDSVGEPTFAKSLDCLKPLGTMVSFGQAAAPVPPVDIGLLAAKGSLFLTRPSLMTYTEKREDLLAHAADLFKVVESGAVKIEIRQAYALKDAAQAHRDLEARKTSGSTVLIP